MLRGNLCPDGAVIKPAAATPELLRHRGPAVVFESIEDLRARLDDPDLEVDEDSVLVLRGCGPRGYPGMPEVGNMALPAKLLARGVRDMVGISDGRMSGTAYGTVVLHVAPEAAAGGPLALVRTGDPIVLDVPARTLHLDVPPKRAGPPAAPRRPRPPPTPPRPAAGSASTSTTSSRPTAAPTSTSWSAPAARRSPASPTGRPSRARFFWSPLPPPLLKPFSPPLPPFLFRYPQHLNHFPIPTLLPPLSPLPPLIPSSSFPAPLTTTLFPPFTPPYPPHPNPSPTLALAW